MTTWTHLSDEQLLTEVVRLAACERRATGELIRSLIEVDQRRLYLAQGYSSLFAFCTQVLHLSEHAAFGRIEVARAAGRIPAILDHLVDGSLSVTTARLLAPHLTNENHSGLIAEAQHKTKREVEMIVARLRPRPDVVSMVRKLPVQAVSSQSCAALLVAEPAPAAPPPACPATTARAPGSSAPSRPIVAPLAPERFKVQFTVPADTHAKLRRAQDLLRHVVPSGDVAVVFDRALDALITKLEKDKFAAVSRPRTSQASASGSRHIPAAVKREVWTRDEGRCAFVGTRGRCAERGFLEFHHLVPFAAGGDAEASNIELRCRAHNLYEADLFFGAEMVRESATVWS